MTGVQTSSSPAEKGSAPVRSRAASGAAWTLASFAVGNVLRLGSNLLLAHFLFPKAFAVVAIASIALQTLEMFSDLGIGAAIVQSPRGNDPAFLNTAWTIQAIRGVLLWLVSVAIAWPLAQAYQTPELQWIIPACGLAFVSTGLQSTKLQTRRRDLDLAKITIMGLCETLLKTAITVVWAVLSPSVWAIIGGSVISYTFFMIATHVLLPGQGNRLAWDREAAAHLTRFGRWVFVSTSLTFLAMQSDRLVLGRLEPMEVLGVYSIAYMFSKLPFDIAVRLAAQVQYPVLAEAHRSGGEQFVSRLLESRRLILAVSQAGVLGIIIIAPWFFRHGYDVRYADAVRLTPLLALSVWITILQASADRALLAAGDARSLAMANGANGVVTFIGCMIGHRLGGVTGFIAGAAAGNLAGHLIVAAALRSHGIRIIGQDVKYSAFVLLVAACDMFVPDLVANERSRGLASVLVGAMGVLASVLLFRRVGWPLARPALVRMMNAMGVRRSLASDQV